MAGPVHTFVQCRSQVVLIRFERYRVRKLNEVVGYSVEEAIRFRIDAQRTVVRAATARRMTARPEALSRYA
jgi:hypothetical protein